MSREQSDDEDSVGETGIIKFGPPNGAKPKWIRHGLPLPRSPEIGGQLLGARAQPVGSGDGRRMPRRSYLTYPRLVRRQTDPRIQPEELPPDQVPFGLPGPAARSSDKQLPGSGAQTVGSGDGRRRARRFYPTYPRLVRLQPDPVVQPEKPTPAWGAFGLPGPVLRSSDKQFLGSETGKKGVTSWTAGRMTTPYTHCGIVRRKSERWTDTGDSGLGKERTNRTGLARESWVPDNLEKKENCGVDASTPRPGANDWPRIRRLRQCAPILETQLSGSSTRRVQSDLKSDLSGATGTLDTMAHRVLETDGSANPVEPGTKYFVGTAPICPVTDTAVPKFYGTVCWQQYQQVVNVIAKSNGWDEEMAAWQLFAHLEGNALNMLLEDKRATLTRLSQALSDYYNSPGRLAIYRRKFKDVVQQDREDPSVFATELEILATRGFADAGSSARTLMVRDRFISGHRDCELRRHLDSVPPDTPIQDIVDRCRVWESHSDQNRK